jgi:hypothetical protein
MVGLADLILTGAGFVPAHKGKDNKDIKDPIATWYVISESPAGGERRGSGSTVTLTIAATPTGGPPKR